MFSDLAATLDDIAAALEQRDVAAVREALAAIASATTTPSCHAPLPIPGKLPR